MVVDKGVLVDTTEDIASGYMITDLSEVYQQRQDIDDVKRVL